MLRRFVPGLLLACTVVTVVLAMPAQSGAAGFFECLFGPSAPSCTTYAPPFSPEYAAPAAVPACVPPCAPTCAPACAPCGSCAPQTCQYMPGVVYRALYAPTAVAAYRPVCGACGGGCATCAVPVRAAYPVTSYRPLLGTYETRLVPYTTYQPLYTTAVSYRYPYAALGSCPGGCAAPIYGAPAMTTVPAPASGCSSCAAGVQSAPAYAPPVAPPTSTYAPNGAPPANSNPPALNDGNPPAPINSTPPAGATDPRKTFQGVEKPISGPELNLPKGGEVRPNSMPAPTPPAPSESSNGRVASVGVAVQPASWNAPAEPADADGWRPVRE